MTWEHSLRRGPKSINCLYFCCNWCFSCFWKKDTYFIAVAGSSPKNLKWSMRDEVRLPRRRSYIEELVIHVTGCAVQYYTAWTAQPQACVVLLFLGCRTNLDWKKEGRKKEAAGSSHLVLVTTSLVWPCLCLKVNLQVLMQKSVSFMVEAMNRRVFLQEKARRAIKTTVLANFCVFCPDQQCILWHCTPWSSHMGITMRLSIVFFLTLLAPITGILNNTLWSLRPFLTGIIMNIATNGV